MKKDKPSLNNKVITNHVKPPKKKGKNNKWACDLWKKYCELYPNDPDVLASKKDKRIQKQ